MSSQPYVDFDDYVDFHLTKTRQNIKSTEVFTTLGWLTTLVVGYLLVFVLADHWLVDGGFGLLTRVLMWVVVLSTAAGVLVWKVILPWSQQISDLYAAKAIEAADPNLKSNLLNYVDLQHAGRKGSPAVAKAMEKRAAVGLQTVDVEQAVDRRPLLRSAYVLLGVVVVACLYTVLSPKDVLTSMKRALLPFSSTHVATQTIISDVTPGDDRVPARTLLTVEADIGGKVPDDVRILYTTADRQDVDQPVEMRRIDPALPRFRGTIAGENGRGVLQNLTYRIVAGDARSPEFTISVVQPPSVKVESVAYKHPDYMRLENKTVASGHIDGWEGTEITLTATSNLPLKSAKIVFSDDEKRPAQPETESLTITGGTQLTAKWKLGFRADRTAPKFYRIECTTPDGQTDPEPTLYTVKIRQDQQPEVVLLSPTGDITMPANGIVPLMFQASDPDFLLRWVRLYAEKDGQPLLAPPEHLLDDAEPRPSIRGNYDFPLEPLKLKSGDVIQYWIEATDNRQPSGNSKRTPKQNIKIVDPVSPEEAKQQLAKEKEKQQDQLAAADDARNPDRPPPPRDDTNPPPRDPNDKPQPKEPNEEPKNEPGEKQKTQEGDDAKPNEGDQQRNADGSKSGHPQDGDAKDGSQQKKADDETALEKLINKLKEQNDQQKEQPNKRDQPGDDQRGQPGEKQDGSKPDGKQQKSNDQKSGSEQGSKGQGTDKQKQQPGHPGEDDSQPEQQPGQTKKNDGGKPGDKQQPGDKPQPGEKSGDDKADPGTGKKEPGADKPGDESPKPNEDGSKSPNVGEQKKPGDKSQAGKKNDGKKGPGQSTDQKSDGNEPGDGTGEKKDGAGEKKSDSGKPNAGKPSNDKPEGDQTGNAKSTGKKMKDDPASKQKPDGEGSDSENKTPSNEKPADDKSATGKSETGKPSDRNADRKTAKPGDQTADQRPSADPKVKPDDRSEKPSAKAPDDKNDDLKGQGKKNQKSQQPDGGEQGASKKSDQGAKGDDKTGAGDKSDQAGDKEGASKKNGGQPGSKKGPGSQTKPSDDGSKSGEPGEQSQTKSAKPDKSSPSKSEPGDGEPNSSDKENTTDGPSKKPQSKPGQPPQDGQPGKADGQSEPSDGPIKKSPGKPSDANAQPGKPGQAPNSKVGGGTDGSQPGDSKQQAKAGKQRGDGQKPEADADASNSSTDQPEDPQAAEQANLDYAKKATNLVLKRLKEQLERGDVDQQLLDELGWTKEDAAKFAKRLEEQLNAPRDPASPEAEARQRQFEELLKSLTVSSTTSRREGDRTRQRRTQQTETRRTTVPPEYREQIEAYTKGLSKSGQPKDAIKK